MPAGSAGSRLPCPPDLLRRPPPRPGSIRELREAVLGPLLLGLELDEVENLEARPPQQPDPVAVAEIEVDRGGVLPGEAVHAEVRPQELAPGRPIVVM